MIQGRLFYQLFTFTIQQRSLDKRTEIKKTLASLNIFVREMIIFTEKNCVYMQNCNGYLNVAY